MTTDYVVIIVKYLHIYNIVIIRHAWDKQGLSKCRCLSHLRYNSAMCKHFPKVHWGCSPYASSTSSRSRWLRRTWQYGRIIKLLAWMFCWSFCKNTVRCMIRLGCFFEIRHYSAELALRYTRGMLLLASTADAVDVSKSAEVELLAVVLEVRESVYVFSPLLSSSPDMDSGEDGIVIEEGFGSAEASATTEASFCWVGLDFGLVVLLGLSLGALATLGITSLPSSSSSEPEMPSPSVPPGSLTLPCRGSKRFLWRILDLPPATLFTVYTGTPGVGWPTTWYSPLSHLS